MTESEPSQPVTAPVSRSSVYESRKRRSWNNFLQYLKMYKPEVSVSTCTGADAIDFFKYLDRFGKTKIHVSDCLLFGSPNPNSADHCRCPSKQGWWSLETLVERLRSAYTADPGSGLNVHPNPFSSREVLEYMREIREENERSKGVVFQGRRRKRGNCKKRRKKKKDENEIEVEKLEDKEDDEGEGEGEAQVMAEPQQPFVIASEEGTSLELSHVEPSFVDAIPLDSQSKDPALDSVTTRTRYEIRKQQVWNTFLRYLKTDKPSLLLEECNSVDVLEYLKYMDQFGKTKVHLSSCLYFGVPTSYVLCSCPFKQSWANLDTLVERLRAAYKEHNGANMDSNPFGSLEVRDYLKEVKNEQQNARGFNYQPRKRGGKNHSKLNTDGGACDGEACKNHLSVEEPPAEGYY